MGQVFYDMGILGSAEVIECSASDLVGQYVGQTGPKTKKLFEKALGKVLFVDEAYRLSQGHFAQEAIDELVGLITQPTFKSKLIIILAGYEQDMNNLMSVNSGLSSRFPHQFVFCNMEARDCLKIVLKELKKKKIRFPELEDESSSVYNEMKDLVENLVSLPDWGNARDMMTLSTELISKALLLDSNTGAEIQLASAAAIDILETMVADRKRRSKIPSKKAHAHPTLPEQTFTRDPPPPPSISTEATAAKPETSSRSFTPGSQDSRGVSRRGRGRRGSTFTSRDLDPASPPSISTEATVMRPETSPRSSTPAFQGSRGVATRGRGRGNSTFTSRDPPPRINTEAMAARPETSPHFFTPALQGFRGVAPRGRGRGGSTLTSRDSDPPSHPSISTEATVVRPEAFSRSSAPTFRGRGRGRGGSFNHQAVNQAHRDPNVSDEVWNALQVVIRAKDQEERDARNAIKALEQRIMENRKNEEAQAEELRISLQKEAEAKEANERAAIQRETEMARQREQSARRARERAAAELQAKKEEERRKREQEARAQQKLRELGVCSFGFRWIPMGDGYRCAGGAHFVSASQLGL